MISPCILNNCYYFRDQTLNKFYSIVNLSIWLNLNTWSIFVEYSATWAVLAGRDCGAVVADEDGDTTNQVQGL